MITLGPYDMDEGLTVGANEITGGDNLLALSTAFGSQSNYSLPPKKMIDKMRQQNIQLPVSVSVAPPDAATADLVTESKKKKRNAKDGAYHNQQKVILAVNRLRVLRTKNYVAYEKVIGRGLGSKGVAETYDSNSQAAIDRASAFLSAFASGGLDKESVRTYVHDDVVLSIPALSSLAKDFEFVKTTFEGLHEVNEASRFLGKHLLSLMSKTVAVKPPFKLAFDVVVTRKVTVSESLFQFASPFVWVTTNLGKCGFTKEEHIHGMVRCDCNSDGRITYVKIYFDPSRLGHLFGSADFNPL